MTKDYSLEKWRSIAVAFGFLVLAVMFLIPAPPTLAHGPAKAKAPPPATVTVIATSVGVSTTAADNTADINKALLKIGSNGTVYFPAGTYQFAGPIVLGSGQHFAGAGLNKTTLLATNYALSGGSVLSITGTGASVSNLTVTAAYPPAGTKAMNGITIKDSKRFAIENVQFYSKLYYGLSITNSSAGTIKGNVFNAGNNYALSYSLNAVKVESLVIESNTFLMTSWQPGCISVAAISASQITSNTFSVPTNQFGVGAIALRGGGAVGISKGVVIANNLCNCSSFSGQGTISITGAGKSLGVENIEIIKNTINFGTYTNY